ncbi:MAG: tyrosine-type recombinase/integrase [Methylococcaceae bacterium]
MVRFLRTHHPQIHSWAQLRRVPHIEDWLNYLHDLPLKANTRLLRVGDVSLFFDDLFRWQWPDAPPPGLLRQEDRPHAEHHLPKPLPPDGDQAIQKVLRNESTLTAMGLLLLRLTGMRMGELRDLKRNAMDQRQPNQWTLHVPIGKTRRERVIPLTPQAVQLVQAIQCQRGSQLGLNVMPETAAQYLMVNPQGRRPGRQLYAHTLKMLTQHLLPSDHIHPHRLRHTFATEMIRGGMSVQVLMKILGHTNPAMTMRYVEITAEDLRCDYEKALNKLSILHQIHLPDPSAAARGTLQLHDLFHLLIQNLEAMHRDSANTNMASTVGRFVKRLRRTRDDLRNLLER